MVFLCTSVMAHSNVVTSFPPSKDATMYPTTKPTVIIALLTMKEITKQDLANSIPETVPPSVNTAQLTQVPP
jgi:hypothetical protein